MKDHSNEKNGSVDKNIPETTVPLLEQNEITVEEPKSGCCQCKYSRALKILLPCRPARKDKSKIPSNRASLFRFLSVSWITTLMWKAYWHGLKKEDLWDLQAEDSAELCTRRLERLWAEEKKLAADTNREPVYHRAARKSIQTRLLVVIFISIFVNVLQFLGPGVFMKLTLDYVNDPIVNHSYGTAIVVMVTLSYLTRCCCFNLMMILGMHTATKLVGAIQGMIFKKLIKLKTGGDILSAQVTNIVTNDLERIVESILSACFLTAAPVLFILGLSYSVYVIGPWALMGLAVYFLFFPIMGGIAKMQSKLRLKTVGKTDKRVALMTEILNSLRLIKMYAWEDAFSTKVKDIRREEMMKLKTGALLQSISSTAVPCVSVLSIMATILGITLTGYEMTAAQIFTIASIFTSMQFTIAVLPFTVRSFAEGKVALARIQKFFDLPEHSKIDYSLMNNNLSVLIKNANFRWEVAKIEDQVPNTPVKGSSKEDAKKNGLSTAVELNNEKNSTSESPTKDQETDTLSGINLSVERGKLIGVCGSIGAGKSSLVSAVCGDMTLQSGDLQVNGRLALVTQQPWIFNGSLRENILVGKPYEEKQFKEVLEVCALKRDLEILSDGDSTEIGERGINLSGGQKQRVNLARAVYSERDIYLMDDPLSAVDTKVAKHIFNKCILDKLADKTVIFVTHGVHFLEKCDEIIYMKNGRICERGAHKSLIDRHGEYYNMMGFDSGVSKADDVIVKPDEQKTKEPETTDDSALGKLTVEETKEVGRINNKVYKKFIEVCGGGFILSLIFLVVLLFNLARLFSIVWIKVWLDHGDGLEAERIANGTVLPDDQMKGYVTDNPNLWIYQLIYASSLIILFVAGISKGIAVAFRVLAGSSRMHADMFQSIMRTPMSFIDVTPIGRIINRFSKDTDEVDVRIPFFVDFVMQGLMSILSQAILVCVLYPLFIAPLVAVAVFFIVIDIFMNAGVRELKRLENMSKSPVIQQIGSAASGLSVIRTFDTETIFTKRFLQSLDTHSATNLVFRLSSRWFTFRMDIMATSIIVAITMICIYTKGSTSTAVAGVALTSINSICAFIPFLMRMKSELQSRFTSVERIMEYAYNIVSEAPLVVKGNKTPSTWPSKGEIVYSNVFMKYRPKLPFVLRSLSFKINASEKIGVVGRTGAGKSSLLTSLLRIVEIDEGKIVIDDIDISKLGLGQLRSSISVIPQDPVLFQGTLRYNLDPFDECSDEAIWLALERSHLKRIVQKLPNKLFSQVQASGDNFSVGEKQLICLTRALLRHTKILVLDEATASVDIETDHLIQETIQEAFYECTVITIAHRLNTVASYDRILVLDAGQMKEFDTPLNLMNESQSLFREMMKAMGVHTVEQMEALSLNTS